MKMAALIQPTRDVPYSHFSHHTGCS